MQKYIYRLLILSLYASSLYGAHTPEQDIFSYPATPEPEEELLSGQDPQNKQLEVFLALKNEEFKQEGQYYRRNNSKKRRKDRIEYETEYRQKATLDTSELAHRLEQLQAEQQPAQASSTSTCCCALQ